MESKFFEIPLADEPYGVRIEGEYTNWKGETRNRRIIAYSLWYGSTEWHPEQGLFIRGLDLEKNEVRDFRLEDFNMEMLRVN
jgi:predicted DNA-binding transcriptional regulator YafY